MLRIEDRDALDAFAVGSTYRPRFPDAAFAELTQAQPAGGSQMTPAQANLAARNLILYGGGPYAPAQDIWQEITGFSTPTSPGPASVYSIYARPVGLVKRFIIEVSITVTAPAGNGLTLTPFGAQMLLNPVLLYDLSNYTRINTTSWHLAVVSTAKRRRPWLGAMAVNQPFGFGNNVTAIASAPINIAATTAGVVKAFFEVPVAYNDDDLRGAIYASVTQATMLLQFTINPLFFSTAGGDQIQSVYAVPAAGNPGTLSNVTFRIYQNYLDKLPMAQAQSGALVPILPQDDISRAVLMNNSTWTTIFVNTDVAIPFVNSREFQSLALIYDNNGVNNPGTDINYLAIFSANLTPLDKVDPILHAMRTRTMLGADLPAGQYYWDFRRRPIDTNQAGNTQAIINPSNVGAVPAFFLAFESIAQLGLVNAAGAIPSM